MSSEQTTTYQIYQPHPQEAATYADFRKHTFVQQLVDANVSRDAAWEHTMYWGSSYLSAVGAWSSALRSGQESSDRYVRGVKGGNQLAGVFIAQHDSKYSYCLGDDYIELVQLIPQYQGQGIGTVLMRTFLDCSDKSAWLHVLEDNVQARKFYKERFGFEEMDNHPIEISDERVNTILMRKTK